MAEADAAQARLTSERLARESASHQDDAEQLRVKAEERLQKADQLDPDVDAHRRDDLRARERNTADVDGDGRTDLGARERNATDLDGDGRTDTTRTRGVDDRDTETGRRI